ncbi:MAG TPA: TetR/AcrR family transcriptional regulator [Acidimicrobiales bacterium]|jgi:AcrR family transcriptional regulator|nr:TetR/AcrR family transcriptional regulator [Acidimicrobiales bacterium]
MSELSSEMCDTGEVATRKYEQRLRADAADETRRRILDAVAQRLRDAPTDPLSLDQVAGLARVARSTIYLVFGSRAGLLQAFANDLWDRGGLADLTRAVAHPDAREHLRGGFRAGMEMYVEDRDVYRVLFSMSQLDPDADEGTITQKEQNRAGGMTHLAQRLAEQQLLLPHVTVSEAADLLWVLTSFESFDSLYTGRGLDIDDVVDLLIRTAERALLRDSDRGDS